MRALLLFWHGVGDAITLTPALRYLRCQGYDVDIVCRVGLAESRLLDHCPGVRTLPVSAKFSRHGQDGPETSCSTNTESGKKARAVFKDKFLELGPEYDLSLNLSRVPIKERGGKIFRSLKICGAPASDTELEVFISPEAETTAREYIAENYPSGYIFRHTRPGAHSNHDWEQGDEWIKSNLPDLPQFDCGRNRWAYSLWPDINVSFVMAREATHRVLSSSVFVHACDAMGSVMDVVHYGVPNPHGLPIDPSKIKISDGFHETKA